MSGKQVNPVCQDFYAQGESLRDAGIPARRSLRRVKVGVQALGSPKGAIGLGVFTAGLKSQAEVVMRRREGSVQTDLTFTNPPILNLKVHSLAGQRDPWLSESPCPRPDLGLVCRCQHGYRPR